ncbi:MAG: ATP-binding protein [Thermodesulfobacteriota bacterium]
MQRKLTLAQALLGISPFLILGIFLVLVPIFIFITIDNIKSLNQRVTEHFTGRGEALIRSFEAGARTGIMIMSWEAEKIQQLLTETTLQSDIEYIMVTDRQGKILAHSDPARVGEVYGQMPELPGKENPSQVKYHEIMDDDSKRIFEVYKRFTPVRPRLSRENLRKMVDRLPPLEPKSLPDSWCSLHFCICRSPGCPDVEQFIFAGFGMERVDAARKDHVRRSILLGGGLFLIGCAGMVSLLAFQAYRSAQLSLVRMKAFSDEVVTNMPAGLVTINAAGTVTSCNRRAAEMFSAVPDNVVGQNVESMFPAVRDLAARVVASRENISAEVESPGPEGLKRVFDVGASPVKDDSGVITGYLMLFKDLTEVRRLEKEIERSRRLAAIGKLAAGVAHEIRNPLSSIKGFATYFKEKFNGKEEVTKTADIMIYEVERLNRAVTQLLEFARPIAVDLADVSPESLISHSLRLVEQDLKNKRIECRTLIQTGRKTIRTDQDRMNQVLLNLYLNAIEAMEAGGLLTVTVADTEDENFVAIDVTDNGRGIPDTDMEQIFDPYFTTRNTGTGLGLAIVYKLIETLGGTISVSSRLGQGTTIHLRVPC